MSDNFIREELRRTGYNLSRTANRLGINYHKLKADFAPQHRPMVWPSAPMPTDISTLGKSGLKQYVVAVKAHADGAWPMKFFNAIQKAQSLYDAGTHEMCQEKRKDGWMVLYLIPRKVQKKRKPYFSKRD